MTLALTLSLPSALLAWPALIAVLSAGGAILLVRQPVGVSTPSGRIGGSVVRWGLRAGRGRLFPAILISWLIWTVLGFAVIGLTLVRAEPKSLLIGVVWTVDAMALLYVLGVILTHFTNDGPSALHLFLVALVLVAMISASVWTWRSAANDAAETAALVIAGGPLVLLAVGAGIMFAFSLVSGRPGKRH